MASILYVGHVTTDLGPPDRFGGSVLYGGLVAHGLGDVVTVCTSAATLPANLPFEVHSQTASANTTFENIYDDDGRRTQRLHALACVVQPQRFSHVDWLHLAPVAGEVDLQDWLASRPPGAKLALSIQGSLRVMDPPPSHVRTRPVRVEDVRGVDLVFASTEDLTMNDALTLRRLVPCLVLTDGPRGAYVFERSQITHAQALDVHVVDPTGAGDAFAAGFVHGWADGVEAALQLGTAAASIMIEHPGTSGIRALSDVPARAQQVVVRSIPEEGARA